MPDIESNDDCGDEESRATANPRKTGYLAALRHRDFRLVWIGTFASNIGSWAQKVATSWLIYQITSSEIWLGADAFASGISTVLLLPWGGVISDRVNRRSLLIWTNIASAALALILAALAFTNHLRVWQIIVVSVLSGITQALMAPASTSILPTLVGEEDVGNAIALNSLQFNVSRVLGPALGGLALIHLGPSASFTINAISFLFMVIALAAITVAHTVPRTTESVVTNLRRGVTFVSEARNIQTLLILVMLAAFFGAPIISQLPALTKTVLHREASTYSLLLSSFGVGAVTAAGFATVRRGTGPRPCRSVPYLVICGICLIAAAVPLPIVLVVLIVCLSGFFFISTMIRLGTALIQTTPEEYRGRVTSLQALTFRLGQPLGSLAAGFIAQSFGVGIAFWAFGGAMIIAVLITWQFSHSLRTHRLIALHCVSRAALH